MKSIFFLTFIIFSISFFSCTALLVKNDNPVFVHKIKNEAEIEKFFTSNEIINLSKGKYFFTYDNWHCGTDTIIEFSINRNGAYDGIAKLWHIPLCTHFPENNNTYKENKYLDRIHLFKNGKLVSETQFHIWSNRISYISKYIKPKIKKGSSWTEMKWWDEDGNLKFERLIWNKNGKEEVLVRRNYGIDGLPDYETFEYTDSLIQHIYYESGELLYSVNIDKKGNDNNKFLYYYKNGFIKAKGFCPSSSWENIILYDRKTHPRSGNWVYYDINGEKIGSIKYADKKIIEKRIKKGSTIPLN